MEGWPKWLPNESIPRASARTGRISSLNQQKQEQIGQQRPLTNQINSHKLRSPQSPRETNSESQTPELIEDKLMPNSAHYMLIPACVYNAKKKGALFMRFQLGDIVRGTQRGDCFYRVTNSKMKKGGRYQSPRERRH